MENLWNDDILKIAYQWNAWENVSSIASIQSFQTNLTFTNRTTYQLKKQSLYSTAKKTVYWERIRQFETGWYRWISAEKFKKT